MIMKKEGNFVIMNLLNLFFELNSIFVNLERVCEKNIIRKIINSRLL